MPREDLAACSMDEPAGKAGIDPVTGLGGADYQGLIEEAAKRIEAAWQPGGAPPQAAPADWPSYHLPWGYGRTRIVLLVRDPYWLHAYWEVAGPERDRLRAETGRETWELPNVLRIHDLTPEAAETGPSFFDLGINPEARSWYIEAGRPRHTFQAELGVVVEGRGFVSLCRSNVVTAPPDRVSDVIDEEWMLVEEDFYRLYRLGAGMGPGAGSAGFMESLAKRLARQMGSVAVSSFGSAFRQKPPGERRFWLVAATDLVVHGATQPDARVTIDGLPVVLRPDGTFSARYSLHDGERAVPITGTSADGVESITITPVVHKETH